MCECARARACVCGVGVGGYVCSLHYANQSGILLNLNCIYLNTIFNGLYFCVLFVNAPYEWNVTKTFLCTC